jgi:hypothetical protein
VPGPDSGHPVPRYKASSKRKPAGGAALPRFLPKRPLVTAGDSLDGPTCRNACLKTVYFGGHRDAFNVDHSWRPTLRHHDVTFPMRRSAGIHRRPHGHVHRSPGAPFALSHHQDYPGQGCLRDPPSTVRISGEASLTVVAKLGEPAVRPRLSEVFAAPRLTDRLMQQCPFARTEGPSSCHLATPPSSMIIDLRWRHR